MLCSSLEGVPFLAVLRGAKLAKDKDEGEESVLGDGQAGGTSVKGQPGRRRADPGGVARRCHGPGAKSPRRSRRPAPHCSSWRAPRTPSSPWSLGAVFGADREGRCCPGRSGWCSRAAAQRITLESPMASSSAVLWCCRLSLPTRVCKLNIFRQFLGVRISKTDDEIKKNPMLMHCVVFRRLMFLI